MSWITHYVCDDGKWIPVRVNGQSGFVSDIKRASMKRAQGYAIAIGILALAAFLLTVLVGIGGAWSDAFVLPALIVLFVTFLLCLAAPVPIIYAWQFNRQNMEK